MHPTMMYMTYSPDCRLLSKVLVAYSLPEGDSHQRMMERVADVVCRRLEVNGNSQHFFIHHHHHHLSSKSASTSAPQMPDAQTPCGWAIHPSLNLHGSMHPMMHCCHAQVPLEFNATSITLILRTLAIRRVQVVRPGCGQPITRSWYPGSHVQLCVLCLLSVLPCACCVVCWGIVLIK